MIHKLLGWLFCLIGDHDWTSAAMQGKTPTDLSITGFKEFARMYCKRCGYNSHLNARL